MNIDEIKEKMLDHRDFFGGQIIYIDEIKNAKTLKDLSDVLNKYETHLEMLALDAINYHCNFRKKLGLDII